MRASRPSRALAAAISLLCAALGCASHPPGEPRYRPTESVLEAVAVLRRHVPDDTYRFEPARDFTGRNVYRASLLRLENLEKLHAGALRAGHMEDVIAFAKGRALERLGAFELAATSYRHAGEIPGPLRHEALRSAAVCDALAEARVLGPTREGARDAAALDPGRALSRYDLRVALLEAVGREVAGSHYEAVIREEIERAALDYAHDLLHWRHVIPDGDVRAVAALQRVALEHRESKNANRHLLALADLYAELAADYLAGHPPEGLSFDPPTFEEYVTAAARLYESVANQDGATERLEAARRLEAFLAFTLRVDRDRFSP